MPTKTKKLSKSAFIRALPVGTSGAQAVAAGKKAGLAFSDKYFYNIRAKAKTGGKRGKKHQSILDQNLAAYASKLPIAARRPALAPKLVELVLRVDSEEVLSLRMPASTAGPALYQALIAQLPQPPR